MLTRLLTADCANCRSSSAIESNQSHCSILHPWRVFGYYCFVCIYTHPWHLRPRGRYIGPFWSCTLVYLVNLNFSSLCCLTQGNPEDRTAFEVCCRAKITQERHPGKTALTFRKGPGSLSWIYTVWHNIRFVQSILYEINSLTNICCTPRSRRHGLKSLRLFVLNFFKKRCFSFSFCEAKERRIYGQRACLSYGHEEEQGSWHSSLEAWRRSSRPTGLLGQRQNEQICSILESIC